MSTFVLIVAAGAGSRFGGDIPKVYQKLAGKPVLRRAAETFLCTPGVGAVRVIIHPAHSLYYQEAMEGLDMLPPVAGGTTRQESVRLGLESMEDMNPQQVLIHDAARPLIDMALVMRVIEGLKHHRAVLPVVPLADTLQLIREGKINGTISRENLAAAQTPQGFHYIDILQAHRQFKGESFTDDATLAHRAGIEVHIVPGEAKNSKLTTPEDGELMNMMTAEAASEIRTGMGFDVHRLKKHPKGIGATNSTITLCGFKVPSEFYLEGHSDGDVAIHAVVDALLGAIGEGDIGLHFPSEDERWRGVESRHFLQHATELLKKLNGEVINVDVTIIGERPRVTPYRDAMRQCLADLLRIAPKRVNVKATTTDKLGFTGRGEGLAAQAVVTVRLPASAAA